MAPILNLFSRLNKSGLDGDVFGVKWVVDSGYTLTRLTTSTDPNKYVTVNVTNEPDPRNDTSPFDNYMPWSGMVDYYSYGGPPALWTGGANYSSNYHYFVYIPTFYYKIIKSNDTWYYYISNMPNSEAGFEIHPGSNRYIGKYLSGCDFSLGENSSSWTIKSKTGLPCYAKSASSLAVESYSIFSDNKGYLCDIATRFAIMLLYLIEYANWDATTKIGVSSQAVTTTTTSGNSTIISYSPFHTGYTNTLSYHTTPSNAKRVKYRNIEDVYGVGGEAFSGMSVKLVSNKVQAYVSNSPTRYYDDSSMTLVSFNLNYRTSGFIKDFGYDSNKPWCCFLPITVNSSKTNTTYNYQTSYVPGSGTYDSFVYYTVLHDPSNSYAVNFFSNTFVHQGMSYMSVNCNGRLIYVP